MDTPRKFFVGIGAQRSGTTWLARYLEAHPQVGLTPFKERHYWTSKYTRHQRYATLSPHGLRNRLPPLFACLAQRRDRLRLLASFIGMTAHRDRSYRRFLEIAGGGTSIAGEITPAYCTLPEAGFRAIEACLDGPRYILLLRNPADRFISQIAHDGKRHPSLLTKNPLRDLAVDPQFALRSDYVRCLRTVRAVVPEERLLVVFYEDLLQSDHGQAVCDRICAFLGVEPRRGAFDNLVNERTRAVPGVDRASIRDMLRSNYEYLHDIYGADLPKSWRLDLADLGHAA